MKFLSLFVLLVIWQIKSEDSTETKSINWKSFDKQLQVYLQDLPNHLETIRCNEMELEYQPTKEQTVKITDFEFKKFSFADFDDLINPYEAKPGFQALRVKFEKFSFRMVMFMYPEIKLVFKNFWLKILFTLNETKSSAKVERVKSTFEKLEWDNDDGKGELNGEVDELTSSKLKVGLKTLENGLRDILDKLLQINHAKILGFLQNEEYLNIGIGDLMTMMFENYNAKQKSIVIDKDWVKDNFEMKKKYDEELKLKSEKKPEPKKEKKKTDL